MYLIRFKVFVNMIPDVSRIMENIFTNEGRIKYGCETVLEFTCSQKPTEEIIEKLKEIIISTKNNKELKVCYENPRLIEVVEKVDITKEK